MKTYVLDTSGLIRSVQREAGAERISEILMKSRDGSCRIVIPAINWGELRYSLIRLIGFERAKEAIGFFVKAGLKIEDVTAERAEHAAMLKHEFGIGYADCFGIELALDSPEHILITADYGAKPAERQIKIEFLPTKPIT